VASDLVMKKQKSSLTYKSAGVNIDAGDKFVNLIKKQIPSIGGFSGLFPIAIKKYQNPILVSSTDNVGTKLLIAEMMDKFDTIGIDLVAMVVNDIIVCGAKPLFLLDYYATPKLELKKGMEIIKGIIKGCKEANCVLLGGETAELPDLYTNDKFDLAGFGVGIIDKKNIIDGSGIKSDDVIIGIESSGLHSNGYSLARKIFLKTHKCNLHQPLKGMRKPLGDVLLAPTKIYVKVVQELIKNVKVKAIAHITGGGIKGNLVRVLPINYKARIEAGCWIPPTIFDKIMEYGNVSLPEMFKTFNMGIGLIIIISHNDMEKSLSLIEKHNLRASLIGVMLKGNREVILEKDGKKI